MSVRSIQGQGGFRALGGNNIASKALRSNLNEALGPWVRNPLWPAVATPTANEILALYAAFGEAGVPDLIAVNMSTSDVGQYRVQLGDGTDTNVNSDTQFDGTINFAALPDLGLPYRICTVRITPVTGGAVFTSVNLQPIHSSFGFPVNPIANWLEVKVNAPAASTIAVTGSLFVTRAPYLENIEAVSASWQPSNNNFLGTGAPNLRRAVVQFDNSVNFALRSFFSGCARLTDVVININGAGLPTHVNSMFASCTSLTTAPLFDTAAVTDMTDMFNGCRSLTSVPLYNTVAVTDMTNMFRGCTSLTSVPLFNTAGTNLFMSNMFMDCSALTSVPLFNTATVTRMNSMFQSCRSLLSVPLFNTASVTTMSSIFRDCSALTSVPLFNTAAVTDMSFMFDTCVSLTSVPLLNTAAATSATFMFRGCTSVTSVPQFNTAAVQFMNFAFDGCSALRTIPALNLVGVTSGNFNTTFRSGALQRIRATGARFTHSIGSNQLSGAALNEYYAGLPTVTGQTLTVSGNYGTATDDTSIATNKGWTITGS